MTFDQLRQYCLSLRGTTEDIKWEEHLCFLVANKIFLITDLEPPHAFAIKIIPEDFDTLTERDGIAQAGHMAKRQWIKVSRIDLLDERETQQLIYQSRQLVLAKLSQKLQAQYAT